MSSDSTLEHIDAVDAFARTLFLRAKQHHSPPLSNVALAVRRLHLALRHLRVEAADADSPLNGGTDSSVYARHLQHIIEDGDFALRQLETLLNRRDAHNGHDDVDGMAERLEAVRSRLASQKAAVHMFLDTVQLRLAVDGPPLNATQTSRATLEGIKDKVDKIATKLFSQRDNAGMPDDKDRLWKEFKTELEKEGFAPNVLHQHKEVLRAYIRELESMSSLSDGAPPTVRGLLDQQNKRPVPPLVPPKISLNEAARPATDNEKSFTNVKDERRMPDDAPIPLFSTNGGHSFSSDDGGGGTEESTVMISTKDLMSMDSALTAMAGLRLHHMGQDDCDALPKHLPSGATGTFPLAAAAELSGSPTSQPGLSPAFVPPLLPYARPGQQPPPFGGSSPRPLPPRLAPDPYGHEIPMDAPWTKIKRSLVSPEALERAGVRYEARPEYVAVLGRLTRERIADLTRKSAEIRAARSNNHAPLESNKYQRPRADSKSSREEDGSESAHWDESDTTDYDDDKASDKGTKSYPFIVSPPNKTSPASTVMPKPILKNKSENRVRFDPEPHKIDSPSGSFKDEGDRRRDHTPRRHRDGRDKESSGRSRDGHRRDGERDRRDRHRGYDGDHHRSHHRNDRDRRGSRRDERTTRKRTWGGTLGAVGIGGAAASLLGVLAEAAVGM